MIVAIALLIIPMALGVVVVQRAGIATEKVTSSCIGATAGIAVFTTVVFVLDLLLKLSTVLLITTSAAGISLIILLTFNRILSPQPGMSLDRTGLVVLVLLFLLLSVITPKMLFSENGSLRTGMINVYGDITWHAALISSFEQGLIELPQNPIYAGTRLIYPFLSDYHSALLRLGGFSLPASVKIPALVIGVLALTLLYCFVRDVTGGNKTAACIALLLFLLGGATLGWIRIVEDFRLSSLPFVDFLTHLPQRDYSGVGSGEEGYHFTNPLTTLLFPQRSFLYSLPIALSILILLHYAFQDITHSEGKQRTRGAKDRACLFAAGILSGLLPHFHAHMVIALIPAVLAFFILYPRTSWVWFLIPALVVGIPEVMTYVIGNEAVTERMIRFEPRWVAGSRNIFRFWFMNTGLLVPFTIVALFAKTPKIVSALAASGLLIFIAGNLFVFAQWPWDNMKLLIFWLIFSLPAIGYLASLYMRRNKPIVFRIAAVLLVVLHIASGGLDIWKLSLPTATNWEVWNKAGINFARSVAISTPRDAIIVTAPSFSSPIALTGRPRYIGYTGHVWSHGISPWEREKNVQQLYTGANTSLPDLKPQFILVGPEEIQQYTTITPQANWRLFLQEGPYALYALGN